MNHDRYSLSSLERGDFDDSGCFFASSQGLQDLSSVKLLLASVDTVKQLYSGRLAFDLTVFDGLSHIKHRDLPGCVYTPGGVPFDFSWSVSRLGKASGYRYALLNKPLGVVVLLGSYYAALDGDGSHLKIELSPHAISGYGSDVQQGRLDALAATFLSKPEATGCAVHLALDVQGWVPSVDFLDRFKTRARVIKAFEGIKSAEYDLNTVAAVYGDRETMMFGRSASLQCSIYRKDKEIIHSDKVDYFKNQWGEAYDESKSVTRIEMRFHHSVVREVGQGMACELLTFAQVTPFFHDLWAYALNSHRLIVNQRLIDANWQLFRDDADFKVPRTGVYVVRIKKESVAPIAKNLGIVLGNMVTLWARSDAQPKVVRHQLKGMFFFPELLEFYRSRGQSEYDLLEHVVKQVFLRRLTHKFAA